jgi:hypothetical protein
MWDFSLSKAIGMMVQTWPFIAFRIAVYFGIGLAYVLSVGAGAGMGWALNFLTSDPHDAGSYAAWGGIAGFGVVSAALYWFREYILYLVKAGHIAVMVELLDGRTIPGGRSQIGYAQGVVRERFVQASILFGVDQVVKGVVGVVTGTVNFLGALLPVPGLQQIVRIVNTIIQVSLTYVDELILAYLIRTKTDNPWAGAQDALVLFAQNYWSFVKNAVWVTLIMYLITIAAFAAVVGPAMTLAAIFPGAWSAWGIVIAAAFAYAFKAALLEPLAIACLMQVFFKKIEGQAPDPEWHARLSHLSRKFQDLKGKALAYAPMPLRSH